MSIKPEAWMYKHKEKPELVNVTDVRLNPKTRNPLYEEIPLIPVSDTHRVVPVELNSAMIAVLENDNGAYQSAQELWNDLLAIIEDKPCSQS